MVHLWPVKGPYGLFYGSQAGLTTSLEHHLEGSPEDTLGGISYIFPLYFTVLLKQLQRLYIGGFIFQVPPVSDHSTCCTNYVLTRSVHQVYIYAFSALTTYLRV